MTCTECGGPIHGDDPHHPHDFRCPNNGRDVAASMCWCDNTTHPDCCWHCHPLEVP